MRRLLQANFDIKVRAMFKHNNAAKVLSAKNDTGTRTFADELRANNGYAVVMRKPFDKWVESVNCVPGILHPLYDYLTVQGRIPPEKMTAAEVLHTAYYASWDQTTDVAKTVSYIYALLDPISFLGALSEQLELPRSKNEWDLVDTWMDGPERERYLKGTIYA
jgi:hypothetical protein